jgi:pantetheine-phosphate adenylyltransferase
MGINMKRAIYSGTFDPITNGHIDILKRGLKIFDEIIIAVGINASKKTMFDTMTRIELIKDATKDLRGISVMSFDNLLVDFAKEQGVNNIIRGLRAVSDFEYELQMGYANNSLDENLETIYLMPTLHNAFVSSSIVRELIKHNGKISHLVPNQIINKLKQ